MKKTIKQTSIFLLTALFLQSCGGGEEGAISLPDPPKDVKYEAVSLIDGPLSEFMEVVPGNYNLEIKKNEDEFLLGYDGTIKVKFRFLKSIDVKAGTGYNSFGPSLMGQVLNESGMPMDFSIDITADTGLARYLKRGSGEEWLTLTISSQGSCENADDAAKQLEKYVNGKKIRFNSEIVEEEFDTESSGDGEDSESELSGSGDCDEFLAGYEEFMDEYITILENYQNDPSDASLVADYTRMMNEASKWASRAPDCSSDPTFAAKLTAIQMKISNAASGI